MFQTIFARVRERRPLVHCITNYVSANDCANILLACGASPVMADAPQEAAEITARCAALCLNLGTLSTARAEAMLHSGQTANRLGLPVVLDPVGAGASSFRTETALHLLREVRVTVIRGNPSELHSLALGIENTGGVDAEACDRVTEANLTEAVRFAKNFARKTGAVVAMTGAIDIVTDGEAAYCIHNGHPLMSAVTGAGCQLSALTAAFLGANPSAPLPAAASAVCALGLAGETAYPRLSPLDGNASYQNFIIDAIFRLTPEALEQGAKYELR